MKKAIVLLVLIGLGGGGYYGWLTWQKNKAAAEVPGRSTTAVAEVRDITFAVNAAGEIAPAEQVSVRPEINGLLEKLPVDVGDHIKKDDLLFKLDDSELQQTKASNLTDIEKCKLGVEKAERDYKRADQLLHDKLISQEVFDDTKTAYDLAKNALERSQRDLAIIEERLTKTEVRAPFDCTILTRPVSIGQAVSGSGGFNSGTEVLTIADLNSMIINAQVNQADVPRLKVGQPVEVTIEAVPGLVVNGVVERISPQASIKNNIKGYPARVVLKNVDPRVLPGMTASVKIPVANASSVTSVPLSAIFTERDPDTGEMGRFVYIKHADTYEKRTVKVGVADFFFAEVQDGLKPGEIVALEMPKDELDKQHLIANQGPAGENGTSHKSASTAATTRTNAPTLGTLAPANTTPAPARVIPAAAPTVARDAAAGKSS
jgi:RND family efflux transporter MFP subunit